MSTTSAATTTVTVTGMTCGCCVNSVRKEVGAIAGVSDVAVDLESGEVTVDSAGPVDPAAIAAAVGKAGYQVTD